MTKDGFVHLGKEESVSQNAKLIREADDDELVRAGKMLD